MGRQRKGQSPGELLRRASWLREQGMTVGTRDPRRLPDSIGKWMVADEGDYCIIGWDLGNLIDEAYGRFRDAR